MFRLETRPGNGTGFATTTNWTVRTAPQGTLVLTASTWYNFVITITTAGSASYTYKLTSATNFTSGTGTITVGDNTHIGVQGDGVGPLSYLDNLKVLTTISDGSSLTDWTNSGCTIDATRGNPNSSIRVTSSQYCYMDLKTFLPFLTTLKGRKIYFDLNADFIVNVPFACNSSGVGLLFRLTVQPSPQGGPGGGFGSSLGWGQTGQFTSTNGTYLNSNTWYSIVLSISEEGLVTYTYNGISGTETTTVTDNNTYIGFHVGGSLLQYAFNFDNLKIL